VDCQLDLYLSIDGGDFSADRDGDLRTRAVSLVSTNARPRRPSFASLQRTTRSRGQDDSNAVFTVARPPGGIVPTSLRDFDQPGTSRLKLVRERSLVMRDVSRELQRGSCALPKLASR
jgi:hypothetical protein